MQFQFVYPLLHYLEIFFQLFDLPLHPFRTKHESVRQRHETVGRVGEHDGDTKHGRPHDRPSQQVPWIGNQAHSVFRASFPREEGHGQQHAEQQEVSERESHRLGRPAAPVSPHSSPVFGVLSHQVVERRHHERQEQQEEVEHAIGQVRVRRSGDSRRVGRQQHQAQDRHDHTGGERDVCSSQALPAALERLRDDPRHRKRHPERQARRHRRLHRHLRRASSCR
eukprot:scaffold1222_cov317-Pavlova_lutheri.AAC.16